MEEKELNEVVEEIFRGTSIKNAMGHTIRELLTTVLQLDAVYGRHYTIRILDGIREYIKEK